MFQAVPVKKLIAASLVAASLTLLAGIQPADAYYSWSYLPYQLGGYLLYPMRSLLYLPYTYMPGRLGSYANQQTRLSYRFPGGNAPMVEEQYADPEPVGDPRQRNRPVRPSFLTKDQVAYAQWQNRNVSGDPGADPGSLNPAPAANASQVPPVAPQRNSAPAAANQIAASSAAAPPAVPVNQGPAPLASGFINAVNDKFDGDIGRALFDPNTRGWAKALGLIDNDAMFTSDFSTERIDIVRKILRDPGLDPLSKLDAVKILLRNSANIMH